MMNKAWLAVIAFAAALASLDVARADETDQFLLPQRESFADLGPYFDLLHYRVLERVVEQTNERIEHAQRISSESLRQVSIERAASPDRMADHARRIFGQGWIVARALESALDSDSAKQAYPEQRVLYVNDQWIYARTHFILDPRQIMYQFRGSTIKVHGVFFGVDKVGHSFDLGHMYYRAYRRGLSRGMSEDDALARAVRMYSTGPISERGIIGAIGTGVISNADLASNYLGFKFYLNMTEPVMLKGELHPPLLVRIGDYWALNHHVRPDSPFMAPFYSDHLNEALNPCTYEWGMRQEIARRLQHHADEILAFYADEQGQPRSREWFEQTYEELSTYYGEDYGHSGIDPVATIAENCFPCPRREAEAIARAKWLDPAATP